MSDPSIIIAPPSNTLVSDDRHTSPRRSRRDLPKRQRRGEDTDRHLRPPLLDPLQLLTRETKDLRGQDIHTREEGDVQSRLLPFQIVTSTIMEVIKEQDYLYRLQKFQVLCNLS